MKKITGFLILIITFFGCGISQESLSDREQLGINGNVNEMSEVHQSSEYIGQDITYANYQFDNKGYLTSVVYQSSKINFSNNYYTDIDEQDRLLIRMKYNVQNDMMSQTTYDYKKKYIKYEFTLYDTSGLIDYKERIELNEKGLPIEFHSFYSAGSDELSESYRYEYDDRGTVTI